MLANISRNLFRESALRDFTPGQLFPDEGAGDVGQDSFFVGLTENILVLQTGDYEQWCKFCKFIHVFPFGKLGKNVAANNEMKLLTGIFAYKLSYGLYGKADPAELLFHIADLDVVTQVRKSELAHGKPVFESGQRFSEWMRKAGDHHDLVNWPAQERIMRSQHVPHVGGIKTAAKYSDGVWSRQRH